MSKIAGKCVCITGGASGVGKILGQITLEKGARQLVIWDINPDNIEKSNEIDHQQHTRRAD